MHAYMGVFIHFCLLSVPGIGLCAMSKINNPYLYAAHILGEEIHNTKVRK